MLVKLTLSATKMDIYLRADIILTIEKSSKNPLETIIVTSIMGPQGPFVYPVIESLDTIADAVAKALADKKPVITNRILQ